MENLVGKKMKGFAFQSKENCSYAPELMDKHIGEVGVVTEQDKSGVAVQFKNDLWTYPLPESLQHIVEEPTVPELTEGILMEVSHDGEYWWERKIIVKYKEHYISNILQTFKYARPIQPKKVTMAELEKLVGGKFEIVNE